MDLYVFTPDKKCIHQIQKKSQHQSLQYTVLPCAAGCIVVRPSKKLTVNNRL